MFVLAATLAWSASGVYMRLLSVDVSTTIALRALFGALFLGLACLLLPNRRDQWRALAHPAGFALVLCQVTGQACFVGAMYYTSIANVMFIGATLPFVAALLARLLLREPLKRSTMVSGLVCLFGVTVIVVSSGSVGLRVGDILAFGLTLSYAVIGLLPKIKPDLPILPPVLVGCLVTFALFLPMASVGGISRFDWGVLALFGATNSCLALVLYLSGAKLLSADEAALLSTADVVLAPTWVWLMFSERPAPATLVGGAIIVVAIVLHAVLQWRRSDISTNPAV
ncbi:MULTISPECIES: DMT family transporter [unclassified Mesorhizobium]|uniref:DMT family transporter n=1 Tax=unclassified Mesorhizobium TaxID=325217 RepID=UPI001FEF5C5A|nr:MULTISPECIES: DMT family transporter [unclassified Mesorhizobium]